MQGLMNTKAQCIGNRKGKVVEQVDRLGSEANAIQDLVDELASRLFTVMDNAAVGETECAGEPCEVLPPLAGSIRDAVDVICFTSDKLRSILSRLEL